MMPAEKKDILIHIINSLGHGGAEVLLCNTLLLLPEYGHVLITLTPPHDQLPELEPVLTAHECLNIYSLRQWPKGIIALQRIIKRHSPLLVHVHSQTTGLLTKLACPRSIPLFYTIHNPYSIDAFAANIMALPAEKLTARRYHHLIGVSALALDDYQKHVPHSGTGDVLYNMVGAEFFAAERPGNYMANSPLKCVSVGNLKKQKNYIYTLEAFNKLRHLPITLDIYGQGPQYEMLDIFIRSNKLKNVTLRGKVSHVAEVLPEYHLYIISSSYEGFGIAPLEAMAAGLPVLTSDIPVFRELAGDMVQYFDLADPGSLAANLEAIYRGDFDIRPYAAMGRERAILIADKDRYRENLLNIYAKYIPDM